MEGADAAPRFLEGLLEAMLQSFYDRFGGLSKLTKGWTGVYMADGGGRMRTRTAMLEISWLPRSLEGADASFWSANVVYFSWVARFFLLLGPRAHLVFFFLGTERHDQLEHQHNTSPSPCSSRRHPLAWDGPPWSPAFHRRPDSQTSSQHEGNRPDPPWQGVEPSSSQGQPALKTLVPSKPCFVSGPDP